MDKTEIVENAIKIEPTLKFSNIPKCGYALESATKSDENILCECMGIYTCDQGIEFYKRMDGFTEYAEKAGKSPSQTGAMICLFWPRQTEVYIDNFQVISKIRTRNNTQQINKGDSIYKRDIAAIEEVNFPGITIPEDAGVAVILSKGWRRGLFFDYRPCLPPLNIPRRDDYDLGVTLGQMLSHLVFSEVFTLTPDEWDLVIDAGWFPFVYLTAGRWEFILDAIKKHRPLKDFEQTIHDELSAELDSLLLAWRRSLVLEEDADVVSSAVDSYKNENWIACISTLMPRIEGILKRQFSGIRKQNKVLRSLRNHLTSFTHCRSLLHPEWLVMYLDKHFVKSVKPDKASYTVNRNTVAHGLLSSDLMDRGWALRLFLLIDHLCYCFPNNTDITKD